MISRQGKARRHKTYKARQGNRTQDKTRENKARPGKTKQEKTRTDTNRQGKARQCKARKGNARQGKSRQDAIRNFQFFKLLLSQTHFSFLKMIIKAFVSRQLAA